MTKINTAVYHSEQMSLLKGTIDRIEAYDVVDIPSEDCAKVCFYVQCVLCEKLFDLVLSTS